MTERRHLLPFGRYAGQPPDVAPSPYLEWMLAHVKLSRGLRAALRDVLRGRGIAVPDDPLPPPPVCPRCGLGDLVLSWQTGHGGSRGIRGSCSACREFVAWMAQTPDNIAQADAGTPAPPRAAPRGGCRTGPSHTCGRPASPGLRLRWEVRG
jgi:hypothetical protein